MKQKRITLPSDIANNLTTYLEIAQCALSTDPALRPSEDLSDEVRGTLLLSLSKYLEG